MKKMIGGLNPYSMPIFRPVKLQRCLHKTAGAVAYTRYLVYIFTLDGKMTEFIL